MNNANEHKQDPFDLIGQEGRIARTSRMIAPDESIPEARKVEIRRRVNDYIDKHADVSQRFIGRQCNISKGTVSEVLRGVYGQRKSKNNKPCDDTDYLRRLNNWIELDARRRNIVQNREFVETSVAREIITVAEIVSETCKMGVVYGPAQIGKSFTLASLEDSDRLGAPVLLRVDESHCTPKALCRLVCAKFKLPVHGTFDALMRRLVERLKDTKRMLMFDEAERANYKSLEFIRDLHDQTGCPVLLAGKPIIRQKMGFRDMGSFDEITDQLAGRVVIRRDLTERACAAENDPGKKVEPLFSTEDIRKLIKVANLELKVTRDAVDWLQQRACMLGMGGIGKAAINLYLAYKTALGLGAPAITAEHLQDVEETTLGYEDAGAAENLVHELSGRPMRRLA